MKLAEKEKEMEEKQVYALSIPKSFHICTYTELVHYLGLGFLVLQKGKSTYKLFKDMI